VYLITVGNEALEARMWTSAWRQNINMAAGYMEYILNVKDWKHGDVWILS